MTLENKNKKNKQTKNKKKQKKKTKKKKQHKWKGSSFPTDDHKAIINKLNSKSNRKRTNIDN